MKRTLRIIASVTAIIIFALHIAAEISGDKRITVFLKNSPAEVYNAGELESVDFSFVGNDDKEYDHIVSHVFTMGFDSVASYPVELIDSIVFGSGNNRVPKETSVEITEAKHAYITGYEDGVIHYTLQTPAALLPSVNDLIYYDNISEIFPAGLCAKVTGVMSQDESIAVAVTEVEPSELFDEYVVSTEFAGEPHQVYIDSEGDEEDAAPEPQCRATVWDGQRKYNMKANVGLSTSYVRYDILSGDIFAKITLTVDGEYNLNCRHNGNVDVTYSSGKTVAVPIAISEVNKKWFNPTMDMKVSFKVKATSSDVNLDIKRKHKASFYYIVSKGDTILYKPEMAADGDCITTFNNDAYLDGTLSLTGSFTISMRPFMRNKGTRAVISTGPSLKGSIGAESLKKMSAEYVRELYDKSQLSLNTSMSVSGSSTVYKGSKVVSTSKMKANGRLSSMLSEGKYNMLPAFYDVNSSVDASAKSINLTCKSSTRLIRDLNVSSEVFNPSDGRSIAQGSGQKTFISGTEADNEYTSDIGMGSYSGNPYTCHARPIINYGAYGIKGPDTGNEQCLNGSAAHPHAIDLGLPSGTKWACCHVGASSPEQYGSVFKQKADFHDSTGDASWKIPTLAQARELAVECRWTRTSLNGVKGWMGTGPNGNRIFMPASGYAGYRASDRWDTGDCTYIWTSSRSGSEGTVLKFLNPAGFDDFEIIVPYKVTNTLYISPDSDSPAYYMSLRLVTQ